MPIVLSAQALRRQRKRGAPIDFLETPPTGKPNDTACFIIADCATGLLYMLIKGESGQDYNIADKSSIVMLRDFASTVAEAAGTKLEFTQQHAAELAGYSKVTKAILDTSKLEALGWYAKDDVAAGIAKTIRYLKESE